MIKSIENVTETEFDPNERFVSCLDDENILMVGYISSYKENTDTNNVDGNEEPEIKSYELTINKMIGIMTKDYDTFVKNLALCNYSTDDEIAIMRYGTTGTEEEKKQFDEHEQYIQAAKAYAKKILGIV